MKKKKYSSKKRINETSHSLAIIYTFCPYVDTSGNVFAKRLQSEIKEKLTVITNKFVSNPPVDESLYELVGEYLHKRIEIQSTFTYRDWKHFNNFIEQAYSAYLNEIENGAIFKNLYSRSMSVITHLVAYKIKMHNPNLKWIAEFSDPIIKEVDGTEREVDVPLQWLKDNGLFEKFKIFDNNQNLFFISELLVYLYADEIIFTNDSQKDFMLNYFSKKCFDYNQKFLLLNEIKEKSKVKAHPILEKKFYRQGKINVSVDKQNLNIAYFGNFNINRGLSEFIQAWSNLEKSKKEKIRLYIFTNMKSENILSSLPNDLVKFIKVEKALSYLDFLGVLDTFDYVLSLDTKVKDKLGINPFLPSKISDYLGSDSKILALLEQDSPTDKLNSPKIFKHYFGNIDLNNIMYK